MLNAGTAGPNPDAPARDNGRAPAKGVRRTTPNRTRPPSAARPASTSATRPSGFASWPPRGCAAIGRASRRAARCVLSKSAECRTPHIRTPFLETTRSGPCVWWARPTRSAWVSARGSTPARPLARGPLVCPRRRLLLGRPRQGHLRAPRHPPAGPAGPDRDAGPPLVPMHGGPGQQREHKNGA